MTPTPFLHLLRKSARRKDKRNAQELISTAKLALCLDSIPQAKELIFAAARKGNDAADILSEACSLAISADWEDDEVFQWMHKAAAISGDDGPIWKITPQDFVDQQSEWYRRGSEIWQMLIRGDIPMFLAAEGTSINRLTI